MLLKTISVEQNPEQGPGCLYPPSTAAPIYVRPRVSVPICVILLTEKEGISA